MKTMLKAPSSQNTEQEYSLSNYLQRPYSSSPWMAGVRLPLCQHAEEGGGLGGAKSEGGAMSVSFFPCPSKPPRPENFLLVSYAVD